ncbi:AIM24 family protein [Gorillibacterium timonense]|uniref:AIM24 family protein n=1 Tax=Gorillibacterium timonense TaxID=1689269 RepID=UPI00071D72C5|nr:AIM24 family protein [Gorillibacterium timonense]
MLLQADDSGGAGYGANGARVMLHDGELLHLLNPKALVAFRGAPSLREDRFMDLKGMYRKRKLIRSDLSGPSEFILSLPAGYHLKLLPLTAGTDLLFDIRSILFFEEGISMKSVLLKVKNMIVTREFLKMKFTGTGALGILSRGPLYEMKLDPDVPVYVDSRCLVAYPENAKVDLCVYGNHLASQHMNYQWEIRGTGSVLLQTGTTEAELEAEHPNDGLIKRVLREVIPFGGVIIK